MQSNMRGLKILERSGRQVCQILTVQRCQYHDMSRACLIGTGAENFPEFEVRSLAIAVPIGQNIEKPPASFTPDFLSVC